MDHGEHIVLGDAGAPRDARRQRAGPDQAEVEVGPVAVRREALEQIAHQRAGRGVVRRAVRQRLAQHRGRTPVEDDSGEVEDDVHRAVMRRPPTPCWPSARGRPARPCANIRLRSAETTNTGPSSVSKLYSWVLPR